ncbi:hypothetical protein PNA2_1425 [Pyrococcus sp. NA2]|uniref:hypothetical protein n=1 Tax=Pyrococcus sp. (strain NA2) TaxID=342949 RepID=UPI000209AF22|nr:hypothetical protein [Pyrococcus sp. NA2]AEC52340.1 hypothetical protein PNA2_1425 [Pyrococcus sp. NA2]
MWIPLISMFFALLIFTKNPWALLISSIYFGFLIGLRFLNLNGEDLALISPGIGFSAIIILVAILSRLKIPVVAIYPVVVLLMFLLSFTSRDHKFRSINIKTLRVLTLASFLALIVRNFFFLLPDYRAADTWFHGSKVRMIIDSGSLYFTQVPRYFSGSIVSYPPGYHALVFYLSGSVSRNIIYAMNTLRIFEFIYLPVATYLIAKEIERRVGYFAALIVPFSALYYYFVQYALLPSFFNYLLFLFAVFLFVKSFSGQVNPIVVGVVSGVVLLVHPYQFIALQIFLMTYSLLTRNFRVFTIQLVTSLVIFSVFYPSPENYASKSLTLHSTYSNKDNLDFILSLLDYSFLDNGQALLGLFFVSGVVYSILRGNTLVRTITLTFLAVFLATLNKVWPNFHIPVISAIWNSERTFMLATPLIPIIEGFGLSIIKRRKLACILLGASLVLAYPFVRIEHLASESSYLLDDEVVDFIENVSKIVKGEIGTACIFDSGRWIPILTNVKISCISGKDRPKYVYLDTRGAGELEPYPLNLEEFYMNYRVILFKRGLWLMEKGKGTLSKEVCSYYLPSSNEISWLRSTNHFVYGWIIKNYAAQKLRLSKYPYAISVSNVSVVAFCSNKYYSGFNIELGGTPGYTLSLFLDGDYLGSYRFNKTGALSVNVTKLISPGFHFLRIECEECSYKHPLGLKRVVFYEHK